jgi:hypothetical protein
VQEDIQITASLDTWNDRISGSQLKRLQQAVLQSLSGNCRAFSVVLATHSQSHATDLQDEVFPLVRLAKDTGNLEIDYANSIAKVFQDTVVSLLELDHNLDALRLATTHPQSGDLLSPSWVTDWQFARFAEPLSPRDFLSTPCNATRGSRYSPVTSLDGSRTQVSGLELSPVTVTGLSTKPC